MSELKKLIDDLEYFQNNFHYIIKEEIDEIFAETLKIMVKRTIYDTNSSRKILLRIISEVFGVDANDLLKEPLFFWNTVEQPTSYSVEKRFTINEISFKFNIVSEGLASQEMNEGGRYPSNNENLNQIRNEYFEPYHLSFTCDQFNAGGLKVIEDLIQRMLNNIANKLERGGLRK